MLRLLKLNKMQFIIFEVRWVTRDGEEQRRTFWSEEFAKTFIALSFGHIDIDKLECEDITHINEEEETKKDAQISAEIRKEVLKNQLDEESQRCYGMTFSERMTLLRNISLEGEQ